MTNSYTELLEQIITEMKTALLGGTAMVVDSEYRQWLDFLRQIHPESTLLKNDIQKSSLSLQHVPVVPTAAVQVSAGLQEYFDLRAIIQLAAAHGHPTWYIQPRFTGQHAVLSYENGELKKVHDEDGREWGKDIKELLPSSIGFSGTIYAAMMVHKTSNPVLIAHDLDSNLSFVQKMQVLNNAGFTTPDFVLFPTEKLLTVSSSKLEVSLANFISTAQKSWAEVDGVVIVSDSPVFKNDRGENSNRIIFKPTNLSLTV